MSRTLAWLCGAGAVAVAVLIVAAPQQAFLAVEFALSVLALVASGVALWALRDRLTYARTARSAPAVVDGDEVARGFGRLHRQIELGTTSPRDFRVFVQPILTEVASRLLLREGLEVSTDPGRAERTLGPDLWAMMSIGAVSVAEAGDASLPADVPSQGQRVRLAAALTTLERL